MTESLLCPHCNSAATLLFRTTDVNRRLSTEQFSYYCCSACKLIFLHPVPSNLGDYYPENYYPIPDSIATLQKQAEPQHYKIDLIRQYVSTGRLLEIGPAFGGLAYLAKIAGFTVDTIEMDERCCHFLREVVGVNAIQHDNPAEALKSLGKYDVIALYQVIEHLPNPWITLDAIVEHLAPGGIIVIAAPNPDSLQWRLFGQYWAHLDAPRHLQLIPSKTLTQSMYQRGMALVFETTTNAEAFKNNIYGWRKSLANLFTAQRVLRAGLYRVGRIVPFVIRPIERSGRRGSTYTLVFQKMPEMK